MRISQARQLYNKAFGIDKDFDDKLFSVCKNRLITLEKQCKIVSMLFLLPVDILTPTETKSAYYLFAATTSQKERGKGYMSELIEDVIKNSQYPIFLKPANEKLIDFYKRFGFKTFIAKYEFDKNFCILPRKEFLDLDIEPENREGNYISMFYIKDKIDLDNITFSYTME